MDREAPMMEVRGVLNPDFFATGGPFEELYTKFVAWAKIAAPVVQVHLKDGRHFWVNRVVTAAEVPQCATFFQEVTPDYRVAFTVPYDQIAYVVLHSAVPPEYRRIPAKKRPQIGFRVER